MLDGCASLVVEGCGRWMMNDKTIVWLLVAALALVPLSLFSPLSLVCCGLLDVGARRSDEQPFYL